MSDRCTHTHTMSGDIDRCALELGHEGAHRLERHGRALRGLIDRALVMADGSKMTLTGGGEGHLVGDPTAPPPAIWPEVSMVGKIGVGYTGHEGEIAVMFGDNAVILTADGARELAANLIHAVESIP